MFEYKNKGQVCGQKVTDFDTLLGYITEVSSHNMKSLSSIVKKLWLSSKLHTDRQGDQKITCYLSFDQRA